MSSGDVGIVGAGASGLIFAAVLRDAGFRVTLYERYPNIGGIWNYNPDKNNAHAKLDASPMYRNLMTNLPTRVMQIPYEPFPDGDGIFPDHTVVLRYLAGYADKHRLWSSVVFGADVTNVEKVPKGQWKVTFNARKDLDSPPTPETRFHDFVVVANGHYRVPFTPPKLLPLKGRLRHAIRYDCPTAYRNKSVLVVGGGPSGRDFIADLVRHAEEHNITVAWSVRGAVDEAADANLPRCVQRFGDVVSAAADGIVELRPWRANSADDQIVTERFDAVLCATGYLYDFPFLRAGQGGVAVTHGGRVVKGLYRHVVAAADPTLAFAVLNFKIAPFPIAYAQAHFCAEVWRKAIALPSMDAMTAEAAKELAALGPNGNEHMYHCLGQRQWDYANLLLRDAGQPTVPPIVPAMYAATSKLRKSLPFGSYQNARFHVTEGTQTFEVIPNANSKL